MKVQLPASVRLEQARKELKRSRAFGVVAPQGLHELPPGNYSMVVTRIRKVRNKPYYRVHYKCLENGRAYSQVIKL